MLERLSQLRWLFSGPLPLVAWALALLLVAAPAEAKKGSGYKLETSWQVDGGAITVDRGYVYTLDDTGVIKFTTSGRKVTSWSDQVGAAVGIDTDPQGNVYVLESGAAAGEPDNVTGFDPNGNYLSRGYITVGGETIVTYDIDIDPKGDIYVGHGGAGFFSDVPRGVLRFSSTGQDLAAWGEEGSGNGQFDSGIYVRSDGKGNVYAADRGNDRIEKFTDTGAYVTQWGQSGTGPGQFINPNAVAIDNKGDVYVVDAISARVQKFNSSGKLLDTIPIPEDSEGYSPDSILDVEVDPKGNVYALENESSVGTVYGTVYVFSPDASGSKACKKAKAKLKKAKKKVKKAKGSAAKKKAKKAAKKAKEQVKKKC